MRILQGTLCSVLGQIDFQGSCRLFDLSELRFPVEDTVCVRLLIPGCLLTGAKGSCRSPS